MMDVLRWEIGRRKAFTLWWATGVSALIAITTLAYKALGNHKQQLDSSFSSITASAGSFFGGSDFFSPAGYLSSQIYYILLPLLLIIMILTLVSSLMHDEADTTVELTLARAITRRRLLLAKSSAGCGIIAAVCVLSYVATLLSVHVAGLSINQGYLLLTHVLTFLFSLTFGAISFALMTASRSTRHLATAAAIVISFGGYVVSSMTSYVSWLKQPAKFMPYHYFDTVALLNGHLSIGLCLYLAGILIVCAVGASIGYARRDIG